MGTTLNILHVSTHLTLSSNNHMYFKCIFKNGHGEVNPKQWPQMRGRGTENFKCSYCFFWEFAITKHPMGKDGCCDLLL